MRKRPKIKVSQEDEDLLIDFYWYSDNRANGVSYAREYHKHGDGKYKSTSLHRTVMRRMLGRSLTAKECVDHIDGDGWNNCRENLRLATREQNSANSRRPSHNTSGHKGVHFEKKRRKWLVTISVKNKTRYIGRFDRIDDAIKAYNSAAKRLRGEFHRKS